MRVGQPTPIREVPSNPASSSPAWRIAGMRFLGRNARRSLANESGHPICAKARRIPHKPRRDYCLDSCGASSSRSPTGSPITLATSPSTRATSVDPSPCSAYPPALPRHSPDSTYRSTSLSPSSPERHGRSAHPAPLLPVLPHHDQPAEHLMLPAGQHQQVGASLLSSRRLPENPPVNHDLRVTTDHHSALGHVPRNGPRLPPRVLDHDLGGLPRPQLLHIRDHDLELNPQRLHQLPPLRRPARKHDPHPLSGLTQSAARSSP